MPTMSSTSLPWRCFLIKDQAKSKHEPVTSYSFIAQSLLSRMDLGTTYKNRDSACNFVHYIAESQRKLFYAKLESCHFYSVLMDSSTDKGWVENELFVILLCEKDDVLLS